MSITYSKQIMLAIMVFFLTIVTPKTHYAYADEAAETFMREVLLLSNKAMTADTIEAKLAGVEELVDEYADIRRTGRFVLGQYARRMTKEQAAQYYPLFRTYATTIYQEVLLQYSGEQLEVTGSIDRSARDIIVNSKISNAGAGSPFADTNFQWRLYKTPKGFKVVDAGANNIWLAIEQRSQFTSIISNNGGGTQGIDSLISQLAARVGK